MDTMAHREWCLRPGEWIDTNEYLRSKNGLFYAVMQGDANFVVYRGDWWEVPQDAPGLSMWNLYSLGGPTYWNKLREKGVKLPGSFRAIMQTNGDFVVYYRSGDQFEALWTTQTHDRGNDYWAVMQDDGKLCIKRNGNINESPIWNSKTSDRLDEKNIELAEMVYDFKNAIVKPNGGPKHSASNTAINGTDINQTATLTMTYTETVSKGWKTSSTIKVGAKTTVKVGVPSVVEGKVETSLEVAHGFEWNQTTTKSEAKQISLPVTVPPGKGVIGKCTWSESTLTVPFRMKGMGTFASGRKAPVSINGTYEGVATHDVYTKWMPYSENEKDSALAVLSAAPSTVLP
jgi:hypothetical protein